MALPTITPADFTGFIDIAQVNFNKDDQQEIINDVIRDLTKRICSDEVYIDARDNDIQKWVDLYNGRDWVNGYDQKRQYLGLTELIKLKSYFEIVRLQDVENAPSGNVVATYSNANGTTQGQVSGQAYRRYNRMVAYYNESVCPFLNFYSRPVMEVIVSSTSLGGNAYEIEIENEIEYFAVVGEVFQISGVDYTVTAVTDATTIQFDAATPGFDFIGQTVRYASFNDLNLPIVNALL